MEATPGRTPLFSSTLSAVIRYMASKGFAREQIELLCKKKSLHPEECTLRNNIDSGSKGMAKYPPAILSDKEAAEIRAIVGEPLPNSQKPEVKPSRQGKTKKKTEEPATANARTSKRTPPQTPVANEVSDAETIGNYSLVEYAGRWEIRNIHNGREHVVECKTETLARQSIASMEALHEELLAGEGPTVGHYKLVSQVEGSSWFALHKVKSTRSRLYATEQLATKYAELATQFEDGKVDKPTFLKALAELDSSQRDNKGKIN